ncbi:K(+)-transporting ATPase subunit F [Alicyclobacillus dauci]
MWVLLLIAIVLAIYLIYVVFHPEQF